MGRRLAGAILAQALDYFNEPVDAYHLAFWCWAGVAVLGVLVILPAKEGKVSG